MKDERIEKFLDGIEKMFLEMGTVNFWPANIPQMETSYNDIFAKDVYLTVEKLKKVWEKTKIVRLFDSPLVIHYLLYASLIIGLKTARHLKLLKISLKNVTKFIDYFFDLLERNHAGDIFCLDKKNLILSVSAVRDIVNRNLFLPVKTKKEKDELTLFGLNLQSLTWAVCFDGLVGYGMEIHGPYDAPPFLGNNSSLIIRDFFDFKQPIWKLKLKFKNIRVMNIYKNVKIEFDMANHFVSDKSLAENLTHWCILIDGKQIDSKEARKINEVVVETRKKQVKLVNSLKPTDLMEKYAEISYYTLRKLWNAIGIKNWYFSMPKIKKRIQRYGPKYWRQFKNQEFREFSYYRKSFDPRVDFPFIKE